MLKTILSRELFKTGDDALLKVYEMITNLVREPNIKFSDLIDIAVSDYKDYVKK